LDERFFDPSNSLAARFWAFRSAVAALRARITVGLPPSGTNHFRRMTATRSGCLVLGFQRAGRPTGLARDRARFRCLCSGHSDRAIDIPGSLPRLAHGRRIGRAESLGHLEVEAIGPMYFNRSTSTVSVRRSPVTVWGALGQRLPGRNVRAPLIQRPIDIVDFRCTPAMLLDEKGAPMRQIVTVDARRIVISEPWVCSVARCLRPGRADPASSTTPQSPVSIGHSFRIVRPERPRFWGLDHIAGCSSDHARPHLPTSRTAEKRARAAGSVIDTLSNLEVNIFFRPSGLSTRNVWSTLRTVSRESSRARGAPTSRPLRLAADNRDVGRAHRTLPGDIAIFDLEGHGPIT